MIVDLPGGGSLEVADDATEADGIFLHENRAKFRTIERWRKPAFLALQRTYAAEAQAIETALWDTMFSRLIDHADGPRLDTIGKLVGVGRNGRLDAPYRARLRCQIAINSSQGRAADLVTVLTLLDPAPFQVYWFRTGGVSIQYTDAMGPGAAGELVSVVDAALAVGIGYGLRVPTDARALRAGSVRTSLTDADHGWSSTRDPSTGGRAAWYAGV